MSPAGPCRDPSKGRPPRSPRFPFGLPCTCLRRCPSAHLYCSRSALTRACIRWPRTCRARAKNDQ
eukprot:15468963-Alexandrium_andersonii.AAC.1